MTIWTKTGLSPPTALMACVGTALIVAICAVVSWTLWDVRVAAWTQAEQTTSNLALGLERDVSRTIASLDLSLRAAAQGMRMPGIRDMEPAIRQSILFDGSIASQTSGGVYISDAAGDDLYNSAGTSGKRVNIADREYFQTLKTEPDAGLVISRPLRSRTTGRWIIALARRLDNSDGSFGGVVVGTLQLADFNALFSTFDVGRFGTITLLGDHASIITRRPFREADVGRSVAESELARHLAKSPSGSYEGVSAVDGVRRIYSYRRVAGLPLTVSVGVSTREVYAEWRQKASIIGLTVAMLIALGIGLAGALWRELRRRGHAERLANRAAGEHAAALARLDVLFRNSSDTMLVAGIEPDGNFVYEVVNPVWEAVTGVSAAAALGRTPQQCHPAAVADVLLPGWVRCASERRSVRLCYRSSDGREWESMVVPVLDGDGQAHKLIAVARDVTRRNQLEAELRQFQRMDAIGQLTTGIAHDFNNLLQAVLGGLEMLQGQAGLDADGRECVAVAEHAARRGATLTHQLLAFSRKQPLLPRPLDPGEVVASAAAMLRRTLGHRITLEVDVAGAIWPVRADNAQLENCLLNLALNARDAMPGGGALRLEVRDVRIDSGHPDEGGPTDLPPGDYVRFVVGDEGHGIAAELLDRVFEPFFTTKPVGRGTGLGLSMVHGFARQSGGDVRIQSVTSAAAGDAVGHGTTVSLWLPRLRPPVLSGRNAPMRLDTVMA